MYEELYTPLPDVTPYWKRLRLDPPTAPDRKTLDAIIFAHQCEIPFENLDTTEFGLPISLAPADIYEKLLLQSRGGCCFELNGLFNNLLTACGYDAVPCLGRSAMGTDYVQPIMHRGTLVRMDGQTLFCDVGFGGPMPAGALPLVDGGVFTLRGQSFRIERQGGPWWLISYFRGGADADLEHDEPWPILVFSETPSDPVDFVPLSHFSATHPNSVLSWRRTVNRRTPTGSVNIKNDVLTLVDGKEKFTKKVESEDEFHRLLKEHFGIVLPSKEEAEAAAAERAAARRKSA